MSAEPKESAESRTGTEVVDRLDVLYRAYLNDHSSAASAVVEAVLLARALEEQAATEARRELLANIRRAVHILALGPNPSRSRLIDPDDVYAVLDVEERSDD